MTWTRRHARPAFMLALLTTIYEPTHGRAYAASYRTQSPGIVVLSGSIDADDERKMENILANGRRIGSPLRLLVLEWSNGGNTDASMAIANLLQRNQVSTRVTGDCSSACATIFAGGVSRSVSRTARVCVHSARDPDTQRGPNAGENVLSRETTMELVRFLWELSVPYSMLGKLAATPPDRVTCADADDYLAWKVLVQ